MKITFDTTSGLELQITRGPDIPIDAHCEVPSVEVTVDRYYTFHLTYTDLERLRRAFNILNELDPT